MYYKIQLDLEACKTFSKKKFGIYFIVLLFRIATFQLVLWLLQFKKSPIKQI